MTARRQPEAVSQRAVIEHLHWRHFPGCFWFHMPNGGYRRPVEAAILQALGVVAGVPDPILVHDGKTFALELKAPGREPTPAQLITMNAMRAAGATVAVAHGADEAIAQLEVAAASPRQKFHQFAHRAGSAGLCRQLQIKGN